MSSNFFPDLVIDQFFKGTKTNLKEKVQIQKDVFFTHAVLTNHWRLKVSKE